MSATVHFMELSHIKELDHLKAHLRYIARKSACVFTNATPEGIEDYYRFAVGRKQKRRDARIAYKFYLALPKDWYWLGNKLPDFWKRRSEELCQLISEVFGVKKEDVLIFFHKPTGEKGENFHAHVVMRTVKADGKHLDVKRQHLKAFHEVWRDYLANAGYQIFRVRDYVPEITPKISRAFDLPVYLYRREDFMPEAKRLYQRIRTEARRLMEMKTRSPTTTEERELREKTEAKPQQELELQPPPQPQSQPNPEPQQQQQVQKPRPKNLDEFVLALARNLLEAGRLRTNVSMQLYSYLKRNHPEKANLVYISNIVNNAWLSLMEERRRKEQRDYPEPDSGPSPPGL